MQFLFNDDVEHITNEFALLINFKFYKTSVKFSFKYNPFDVSL